MSASRFSRFFRTVGQIRTSLASTPTRPSLTASQVKRRYITLKLPSKYASSADIEATTDLQWSTTHDKDGKGTTMTAYISSPLTVTFKLPIKSDTLVPFDIKVNQLPDWQGTVFRLYPDAMGISTVDQPPGDIADEPHSERSLAELLLGTEWHSDDTKSMTLVLSAQASSEEPGPKEVK